MLDCIAEESNGAVMELGWVGRLQVCDSTK